MSNNKQSSVEWLIDELALMHSLVHRGELVVDEFFNKKCREIVKQAKAMHKEEIVAFTADWHHKGLLGGGITVSESIKEHYTKTFKDNHEQD